MKTYLGDLKQKTNDIITDAFATADNYLAKKDNMFELTSALLPKVEKLAVTTGADSVLTTAIQDMKKIKTTIKTEVAAAKGKV